MSDVREGRRAGPVGRGRSDEEPDRGTVDDVGEYGGRPEDVRDDEATRAGETAVAELPQRVPPPPRGGDGARAGAGALGGGNRTDETAVVEELLTRLAAAERAREEAEAARDEATRRADALAAALEDSRARPVETFGMRADKVLRMADHEAAQRRRAAEDEAQELRARTRAEASRITAEARADAQRIVADAAAEVDRQSAAGAAARRDGELLADTAASMHSHVAGLRSSVRDEIARLHTLLGTELNRLDGPARMVSGRNRGGDTGPLPAVSLPEQRAGAAGDDGGGAGEWDDPAAAPRHDAEPAPTTGHTGHP